MGPIPETIGNITGLEIFEGFQNDFTGMIPAGMWTLANLRALVLTSNSLSGTIATEIGNLGNLGKYQRMYTAEPSFVNMCVCVRVCAPRLQLNACPFSSFLGHRLYRTLCSGLQCQHYWTYSGNPR